MPAGYCLPDHVYCTPKKPPESRYVLILTNSAWDRISLDLFRPTAASKHTRSKGHHQMRI